MKRVTFYTKVGCTLCDDAFAELTKLAAQFSFSIDVIDIRKDPSAREKYRELIPVAQIGAHILTCDTWDEQRLREIFEEVKT